MSEARTIGFFVTCLVNLFRPIAGFASVTLVKKASCGAPVEVPVNQTCCGLVSYNSGDEEGARKLARKVVREFAGFSTVVVPSCSCTYMIRQYPELLKDDPAYKEQAEALAKKTFELTEFLSDAGGFDTRSEHVESERRVFFHDSCSGLRKLKLFEQPRRLLSELRHLQICEPKTWRECCGFGGSFCLKFPEIAASMADAKVADILETQADMVVSCDLGCLLHLGGRLTKLGHRIETRHISEVLAGQLDEPPI